MRHRKKVCIVSSFYSQVYYTGSSYINRQIAEILNSSNYDVTIITSDILSLRHWRNLFFKKRINQETERGNMRVIRIQHKQIFSLLAYLLNKLFNRILPKSITERLRVMSNGAYIDEYLLKKILVKEKFEIIYFSTLPHYINVQLVNIVNRMKRRPMLIFRPEVHILDTQYKNSQFQIIFDSANIIHALSRHEKQFLIDNFNVKAEKIFIQPNCLDLKLMLNYRTIQKEAIYFKKKYGLANKKIVLFAGTKNINKGAILTLHAVRELYRKDKNHRLIAIGHNTKEWTLSKLIMDTSFLIDLNFISERLKQTIFSLCGIYCMPSSAEAFGLTYLEAWHKKKPVIAFQSLIEKELIEENNAGICISTKDKHKLYKVIHRLFNNRTLAKEYGMNGYKVLLNKYSLRKNKENYVKLFNLYE